MDKVIGNIVAVPNPKSDWNQTDETKADFIRNKPTKLSQFENDCGFSSSGNPEGVASIKPFVIDFGTDPSNRGVGDKTYEEITEAVENGMRIVGKFIIEHFEFTSITISMGYVALYGNSGKWYVWADTSVRPETSGWEYFADEKVCTETYVDEQIGDIETALDGIIEIQNSLIGGDGV